MTRARIAAVVAAALVVVAGVVAGLVATAPDRSTGSAQGQVYPSLNSASVRKAPAGGLSPGQIRAAYGLPPLSDLDGPGPLRGITGRGQTIVIVDSFGSPTISSDLAGFDRFYGLPAPPSFRVLQPAGPVPAFSSADPNRVGWAQEATLDVEWAHVMAPGASIVLVETPTSENEGTTGFPQIVTAEEYVLRHHLGQVISQSFAATEQTFPAAAHYAALRQFRGVYEQAARDHVTVVSATGDTGATADEFNMQDEYTTPAISWPASDPLVTAVGGTRLYLRANGSHQRPDVAWSGSGGGLSIVFPRPAYQDGVKSVVGDHRGVPDISMDASCGSAVAFRYAGQWSTICGTSLATPLFAGIVALADQVAGHGHPHGLGAINPAIYRLAARHAPGIVDVVSGNNTQTFREGGKSYTVTGFAAGKDYDLVSGVGTVDGAKFVPELAAAAG